MERGGKFKDRARLGIRFHTLVLADGSRMPISTDTIYRYGDAPGDGSAKKIGGGAVAGAILGAIIGGAKGAAVGATAGAGGGTAMVMAGDRNAAEFPAGTDVTARILSPVTVTVDRNLRTGKAGGAVRREEPTYLPLPARTAHLPYLPYPPYLPYLPYPP